MGFSDRLEVVRFQSQEKEHHHTPQNTIDGIDLLVKNCLVASANPTKPTCFMNPAVRAIARAYAATPASSPPLADNAEAVATVQHVCVNTHLCSYVTDTIP
jgi:hypothetical protein